MSTITVTQARLSLEAAQLAYISADVMHPTQIITTKEALNNARHDYLNACAALCTKLEFATDMSQVESELINQGIWK